MIEFCTKLLCKKSSENRRKLSVQVIGSSVINEEAAPDEIHEDIKMKYLVEGPTFISEMMNYKQTLEPVG